MTFDALLRLAREYEWTLAQLMAETGCGHQCGLCRPYLGKMLETGQTRFRPELLGG
jgi:bacterioferritin-associated ferredoxin